MDDPNNADAADAALPAPAAANNDDQDEDVHGDKAICTEAMNLLRNRLNFPSRLRHRTMVQFAQRFIANVDADADANPDVDVATLDPLDPVQQDYICLDAMSILFIVRFNTNRPSLQLVRSVVRFAQLFITNVKEDIHTMLTDMRTEDEGYDGFDSERDTEAEVETAIRCNPGVLSRRDDLFGLYPIQCRKNVKNVMAVHLFVQLAMEFNTFTNEERGGLLIEDTNGENVLQNLVALSSDSSYDESHHRNVDTTFLAVLIRLRKSGYFLKGDIQQYELVHHVCRPEYLFEQRFRYLSEWCPSSLLRTNVNHELPFHWGTINICKFRVLIDAYFRFYPRWKGINALFAIDSDNDTPFSLACESLTRTKVGEIVEEVLVRYTTNNGMVNITNNNNGNAMILAAIDNTIGLGGLFFVIQRHPDIMSSMLRHRKEEEEESTTMVSSFKNNNNSNNNRITNRTIHDPGVDSKASEEENNGTEDGHHNEDTNTTGDNINNDDNNPAKKENGTKDGRHNKNDHDTGDNINDVCSSNIHHNSVTISRSTRKRKHN